MRFIEIISKSDWLDVADEHNDYIELRGYTQAGEDFNIPVYGKNEDALVRSFKTIADQFDIDEHATLMAQANGAPSISELVDDARWIKTELQAIANQL